VDLGLADGDSAIFGHLQPRRTFGFVIETVRDDLISRLEFSASGAGDRVDDALPDLCPAGAVEERGGLAVDGLGEGRALRTDPSQVKRERGGF
jgi:hypothetical protein